MFSQRLPGMSAERKKQIRAGHRSSSTKLLTKIYDLLETSPIDCGNLTTLRLGLNEKRSKLRTLDDEIVDLIVVTIRINCDQLRTLYLMSN